VAGAPTCRPAGACPAGDYALELFLRDTPRDEGFDKVQHFTLSLAAGESVLLNLGDGDATLMPGSRPDVPTGGPVMSSLGYHLEIPQDFRRTLAAGWLMLGIAGLLISGLFVVLIVLSRTPGLESLFPLQGFFHLAIVAHVDFSVLVWFGACGAMIWSLATDARAPLLGWTTLAIAVVGAVLMAVAPFQGGQAIMSNYVPVLDNASFLAGLALFALGATLMAARSLAYPLPAGSRLAPGGVLRFGSHTSAIAILLSAGALVWSLLTLPDYLFGPQYFETLFWGSGHILQFAWVQLVLVSWLWLAAASGLRMPLTPRLVTLVLLLGILPAFLGIWAYLVYDVAGPQHRTFFIWLMAAGGGVAAGPIALALLHGWRSSPPAAGTTRAWPALRAVVLHPAVRHRRSAGVHDRLEQHHGAGALPRLHRRGDPGLHVTEPVHAPAPRLRCAQSQAGAADAAGLRHRPDPARRGAGVFGRARGAAQDRGRRPGPREPGADPRHVRHGHRRADRHQRRRYLSPRGQRYTLAQFAPGTSPGRLKPQRSPSPCCKS
jgi:hypothetical protein